MRNSTIPVCSFFSKRRRNCKRMCEKVLGSGTLRCQGEGERKVLRDRTSSVASHVSTNTLVTYQTKLGLRAIHVRNWEVTDNTPKKAERERRIYYMIIVVLFVASCQTEKPSRTTHNKKDLLHDHVEDRLRSSSPTFARALAWGKFIL